MGQKVHPDDIRLGTVKERISVWHAGHENYADYLFADLKVREYPQDRLKSVSVSYIDIHRPVQTAHITIHTARPGTVIGKKGEDVEKLRQDLTKQMGVPVHINIEGIRKPELDTMLVAQNVVQRPERCVMSRCAMKHAVQSVTRIGTKGIKVQVSGRLDGIEVARTGRYREGRVPLYTLRADIDYATCEAHTTYDMIGTEVRIFRGRAIGGRQEESKPVASAPHKKAVR